METTIKTKSDAIKALASKTGFPAEAVAWCLRDYPRGSDWAAVVREQLAGK